jgi:hypothetical protein
MFSVKPLYLPDIIIAVEDPSASHTDVRNPTTH